MVGDRADLLGAYGFPDAQADAGAEDGWESDVPGRQDVRVGELVIEVEDPRRDDIRALLEVHLAFARGVTPVEHSFALDLDGLLEPSITFFSARDTGNLLGVAALKELDAEHLELKSMHTAAPARRRGVARALVDHLVAVARMRGARRVSLETGTADAFEPARALYASTGFVPCGPFGDYAETADNTFMTRVLD